MRYKTKFIVRKGNKDINVFELGWIEAGAMVALASKKSLWEEINKTYEEHKDECSYAYQKSRFYNLALLESFTAPVHLMSIKLFSLYAWHEQNNTADDFLAEWLNKGYKRYVDYIKNSTTFSWSRLDDYMNQRENNITEIRRQFISMVIFYLLGENLKKYIVNDSLGIDLFNNFILSCQGMGMADTNFQKGKEDNYQKALQKISSTLGFKIPKSLTFDDVYGEHENMLINSLSKADKRKNTDTIFEIVYKRGIAKYYKSLTANLRTMGFNDFSFTSGAFISREDFVSIYTLFESSVKAERLKEEEWELYFTASFLLIMMGKHYEEVSSILLSDLNKDQEDAIKKHDELEERKQLNLQVDKLEAQNEDLQSQLDSKDAYIEQLERQLKQKDAEKNEEESYRKEVIALRNYAYQHQEDVVFDSEETQADKLASMKDWLSKHDTVVFGGHPNLINKMKDILPTVEYRDVDTLNRSLDFLKNKEVVFLITNFFNHPFYYKLMSELQKLPDTKLVYLTGYSNIDRTILEMESGIRDHIDDSL